MSYGVACDHWLLPCYCHGCVDCRGSCEKWSCAGAGGVLGFIGWLYMKWIACWFCGCEVGIVAEDVTMRESGLPGAVPSSGQVEDHALAIDQRVV